MSAFSLLTFPVISPRLGQGLKMMLASVAALFLTQCASPTTSEKADVIVSVKDQRMGLYKNGNLTQSYKISTSKFGVGDKPGSCCTPLGKHEIIAKIGHGLPKGAVLHNRHWSGEVIKPNAPGRDPIVSRILWLGGLEAGNRNASKRFIYIHGTAEEHRIGSPASYGCVRMRSNDVVTVFDKVSIGDTVLITKSDLPNHVGIEAPHKTVSPPVEAPFVPVALPKELPLASNAVAPVPASAKAHTPSPRLRAVPVTIAADGRVVPLPPAIEIAPANEIAPVKASAEATITKKKGESAKAGSPTGNGRQALHMPVTRSV